MRRRGLILWHRQRGIARFAAVQLLCLAWVVIGSGILVQGPPSGTGVEVANGAVFPLVSAAAIVPFRNTVGLALAGLSLITAAIGMTQLASTLPIATPPHPCSQDAWRSARRSGHGRSSTPATRSPHPWPASPSSSAPRYTFTESPSRRSRTTTEASRDKQPSQPPPGQPDLTHCPPPR